MKSQKHSWMRMALCLLPVCLGAVSARASDNQWLRPLDTNDPLIWGRRDGIVFGLPSEGGMRGPRGLIRIGIFDQKAQEAKLVNFVAIEPVVPGAGSRYGRLGFSELEPSQLDPGRRGKRLWVPSRTSEGDLVAGELITLPARPDAIEQLSIRIEVEPFVANNAHVYLVASIRGDKPDEVRFEVYHHADSAPIEELTLTATMGNYERLRHLWLADRVVKSLELYGEMDVNASGFMDSENYTLSEMLRYGDGDALVLATTDEDDPSVVRVQERPFWTYQGPKLTQYWRVPAFHIQPDLRVKVNGRRTYWRSDIAIPGGEAFENIELRQRYVPGQVFVFGLNPKPPQEFAPRIPRLGSPAE